MSLDPITFENVINATKDQLQKNQDERAKNFHTRNPWVAEHNLPTKILHGQTWVGVDITVKVDGFESDPLYGGRGGELTECIPFWKAVDVPPIQARVWILPSSARNHYELDVDSEGSFPHMLRGHMGGCHHLESALPEDFALTSYDDYLKMKRVLEHVNRRANIASLYVTPSKWFQQYKDALPSKLTHIQCIEVNSSLINLHSKFIKAMVPDGTIEEENATWQSGPSNTFKKR
jgi:hypothetical protein